MNEDERTFGNYRELKELLETLTEEELEQSVQFEEAKWGERFLSEELVTDEDGVLLLA